MIRAFRILLVILALATTGRASAQPLPVVPPPAWTGALRDRLETVDAGFPGEIGVYVHHVGLDESFSYRAEERWYLASGIKVPVAITVLRRIEDGELALESRIRLQPGDYVDGAGQTNAHPVGTPLRIDYLLEQMLVYSDNTATDALIRTVGLDSVNAVAAELLEDGGLVITSLADVRRRAYGMFHPGAADLDSQDMFALRRAAVGPARVHQLAELLGVTPTDFLYPDLDSAFEAYYATHVNSAPLQDFGRMLTRLADGLALGREGTAYLLDTMTRAKTGARRIKAGLPRHARFAHKTGTQHRRACDMGIVTMPVDGSVEQVVIVACVRGVASTARNERALREVGNAVTASGVLARKTPITKEATPYHRLP
ncbi:serine hydrolase [Marilutibacter chinensis]|uniref:beta-lactamase n=1 Tax=Marilutibacter chinensis TaxID=2912247 RepID=A0ABS9HQG3_9GAMM|nr:serine hydrolase [Lysobacter chinensis]MCF7220868.1 class A beta-lactamase-related serine hydrolase [Lysobacter chinensis]